MTTSSSFSIEEALSSSPADKGHRLGNFHSYYEFHPPENRVGILQKSGIIDYILHKFEFMTDDDDEKEEGNRRKKLKILHDANDACIPKNNNGDRSSRKEDRRILRYCDLGCNEGTLTLSILQTLHHRFIQSQSYSSKTKILLQFLGLDIDAILIQRANEKLSQSYFYMKKDEYSEKCVFKECNLCDEKAFHTICHDFLGDSDSVSASQEEEEEIASSAKTKKKQEGQQFDLTTIFSTTMWIHVHSGDDGLTAFLQRACDITRNILIVEPQPSKCYRNINTRLRKMNRPQVPNISTDTLKMRSHVEKEVERVVTECGFRRVFHFDCNGSVDNTENSTNEDKNNGVKDNEGEDESVVGKNNRTAWNRMLQIYERIDSS